MRLLTRTNVHRPGPGLRGEPCLAVTSPRRPGPGQCSAASRTRSHGPAEGGRGPGAGLLPGLGPVPGLGPATAGLGPCLATQAR
jgi:hypothetical protein